MRMPTVGFGGSVSGKSDLNKLLANRMTTLMFPRHTLNRDFTVCVT
jgi:hypothetical protein